MTKFRNKKPELNQIGELSIECKREPEGIIIGKADVDNQVPIQVRSMTSHYIFPIDANNLAAVIRHLSQQLNAFKKKGVLVAMLFMLTLNSLFAQNFTPVWQGNGTGHMNIYVRSATVDNQALEIGDQIAIFSGSKCVGITVISADYLHKEFLKCDIITSQNDGTGNGFNTNDSILIKIWDKSLNKEVDYLNVEYYTDLDFWSQGKFSSGGSAFITIEANNLHKKKVLLKRGTNTLSISLSLSSNSLQEVFQTLIDDDVLLKIQDNTGRAFERLNQATWINSIGEIDPDKTYTVIVNQDCELELEGLLK